MARAPIWGIPAQRIPSRCLDPADGVRRSCSASPWTTRCSFSPGCARSTTPLGLDARARSYAGSTRTGRLVYQRRADPVPGLPVAWLQPRYRDQGVSATGLAVGILLDATVIRALLVPAARSRCLGRWNWSMPAGGWQAFCVSSLLPGSALRACPRGTGIAARRSRGKGGAHRVASAPRRNRQQGRRQDTRAPRPGRASGCVVCSYLSSCISVRLGKYVS